MTSFIGAPITPHIGKCGNFFMGDRDGRGSRHCLEPVLALGGYLKTDRDICQRCRARATAHMEELTEAWATQIAESGGAQDWIDRNNALVADSWAFYARRGAEGAPIEELFKIRRDIEMRVQIQAAIIDKMPADAGQINTLVGAR